MYSLALQHGRSVLSQDMSAALASLPFAVGTELHARRCSEMAAIERLEARGMQYSNHDFDVLSSALNFLDAVAPETADGLRTGRLATCAIGKGGGWKLADCDLLPQVGSMVRLRIKVPSGESLVAGTVKRILPAGVEVKTQLHGYHVVPASECLPTA